MMFKLLGKINGHSGLLTVALLVISLFTPSTAQSTIDPEKTVNLSTGSMGFHLPLAQVKGINGHDFPINLTCQSGITIDQEASPTGLGFNISAGSITRKIVFVPDMNHSERTVKDNTDCDINSDKYFAYVMMQYASSLFTIIASCFNPTTLSYVIFTTLEYGFMGGSLMMSLVGFNTADYKSGGKQLLVYDAEKGNGVGFFMNDNGKQMYDLPDIYYINTPYISGEMKWVGTAANGYFIMKGANGTTLARDVVIQYDPIAEKFTIITKEGIKLIFDVVDYAESGTGMFGGTTIPDGKCYIDRAEFGGLTAQKWNLSKVLFPDFDGNEQNPEDSKCGSWIKFTYDKMEAPNYSYGLSDHIVNNWWLQYWNLDVMDEALELHQVSARYAGIHAYDKLSINYLKGIITSNESADFNYKYDRLDCSKAVVVSSCHPRDVLTEFDPPASCVPFGGFQFAYFLSPRLSTIKVYSSANILKQQINFNTDYYLRPNTARAIKSPFVENHNSSYHSHANYYLTKDVSGNIITSNANVALNPTRASLTLKSIQFVGNNGAKMPLIHFKYSDEHNHSLTSQLANLPQGVGCDDFCIKRYQTEDKDIWGYYNPQSSIVGTNDFNVEGSPEKANRNDGTAWADAWSLDEIIFPTGKKIKWYYESNQYDAVNGISDALKYTGGIRVKKIVTENGFNKKDSLCYFYIDDIPGVFTETSTNSSGHATVEPSPYYLLDKDESGDNRKLQARGGLYTPAKVIYEKVITVKNYNATGSAKTPNGYSLYDFTTSKDYPNCGLYGEIEYGWKRGFLDTLSIYNKSNTLVKQHTWEYEFSELNNTQWWVGNSIFNSYFYPLSENTYGWVKLSKEKTTTNHIATQKNVFYAPDLSVPTEDRVDFTRKEFMAFDAGRLQPKSPNLYSDNIETRTVTAKTKKLGDPGKDDYIIIRSRWQCCFTIRIVTDETITTPPHRPSGTWSKNNSYSFPYGFGDPPGFHSVVGAAMQKMDTNDKDDLIVVSTIESIFRYLYVTVIHDIDVDGQNEIQYDTSKVQFTAIQLSNDDIVYLENLMNQGAAGCIITNIPAGSPFNDPNKPDIVMFPNINVHTHFPGDLDPVEHRRVFAFIDFWPTNAVDHILQMPLWRTTDTYAYCGYGGYFTNADNGIEPNDLVIVGPGSVGSNIPYCNWNRPMTSQVFKNFNLTLPNIISFSSSSSIIQNPQECTLFKAEPENGNCWDKTKFAGVYNDDSDAMQEFIFSSVRPENEGDSDDKQYFHIVKNLPVRYLSDYDGQMNRTSIQNSDKNYLVSTLIPAYAQSSYALMGAPATVGNKNMLLEKCGSVTYLLSSGIYQSAIVGDLTSYSDKVVAATAATWGMVNNSWLPKANYSWMVPMNSNGLPTTNFIPFNYTSPASNDTTVWKMADSICKYTLNNLPKETAKPTSSFLGGRLYTSIIYGHGSMLPIALVTNARWEECGVFTGDYQKTGNLGYWDYENGWEIGFDETGRSVLLADNVTHFGHQVIAVTNNYAASRNNRIYPGKSYTFSAWVKVTAGRLFLVAEYRSRAATTDNTWPILHTEIPAVSTLTFDTMSVDTGDCKGQWKLVELTLPASKTSQLTGADTEYYARTWIGNHDSFGNTEGVHAYIDDIRFAPANAMVTTTYYNTTFNAPILSVDANNNPGHRITYDSFGRPVKWEKINPSKTATEEGYATIVQSKRYHLSNNLPDNKNIQVNYPNGGNKFFVGGRTSIYWVQKNDGYITIQFRDADGSGSYPDIITSQMYNAGYNEYEWTVPVAAYGSKIIKVQYSDGSMTESDVSDRPFIVTKPLSFPPGWRPYDAVRLPEKVTEVYFAWPCIDNAITYKIKIINGAESTEFGPYESCNDYLRIDLDTTGGNYINEGFYKIVILDGVGNRLELPTLEYKYPSITDTVGTLPPIPEP